ncbi:Origin of replication complex subunit 1A, partial [Mucuna pruriens]
MTATPSKSFQIPAKFKLRSQSNPKSSLATTLTPQTLNLSSSIPPTLLIGGLDDPSIMSRILAKTKSRFPLLITIHLRVTPAPSEKRSTRKRNREGETSVVTRAKRGKSQKHVQNCPRSACITKVGEFELGDDVSVRRREDAYSDDEDAYSDDCLGGFHLKCLAPPLKDVPEGNWICGFCEARKMGREVEFPKPPKGKKLVRTMREKLLSNDNYWCRMWWYTIPEETSVGRQSHNLRRELYRSNDFADIEMESVLIHCYVMTPQEYAKAGNEGDDVFLCEYEYDIHWHSFKRLADIDSERENGEETDSDEDWNLDNESDSDTYEDVEYEQENIKNAQSHSSISHHLAAKINVHMIQNLHKRRFFGLQKIGLTNRLILREQRLHCCWRRCVNLYLVEISMLKFEHDFKYFISLSEVNQNMLLFREMEEITTFMKGAISDEQCLGRCLYIHGVPGTGKTMSVLSVMRSLKSEVDAGNIKPYSFVEINGLKLASPENIYRVIYEALNGHRVSWKKALHMLNERFVEGKKTREEADRPCILLIDELDLLVSRNQSVLYNILDWPTMPHFKIIVIGIANTMDLPEKLLPRISSRMGIQRLCFGPYNYQQLQEINSSRLKGIDVFEKQAVEFASRKRSQEMHVVLWRYAAEIADYRMKKLISNPDFGTADNISYGATSYVQREKR